MKSQMSIYRILTPYAALGIAAVLVCPAARAQKTNTATPSVTAPAKGAAAKPRVVLLSPVRAGNYSFWITAASGSGAPTTIPPDQTTVHVNLPDDAKTINVLDNSNSTIALYSADTLKSGGLIPVSPDDFKRLRYVQVTVVGKNQAPVADAKVSLKDSKSPAQEHILSAADKGVVRFENVLIGSVTVTSASGAARASSTVVVTPTQGNVPFEITLSLSGSVSVIAGGANAAPAKPDTPAVAGSAAAPADPASAAPRNDWTAGVIGLGILTALGFFGYRFAQTKQVSVPQLLKQVGVELPNDAVGSDVSHLRPPKSAPEAAPLASLADLPPPPSTSRIKVPEGWSEPISNLGNRDGNIPPGLPVRKRPRLVAIEGIVIGESFALQTNIEGFTIGRDLANSLSLDPDAMVSRAHARVESRGSGWAIVDQGSSNGTFVNGERTKEQILKDNDEIQIGASRFRFEA